MNDQKLNSKQLDWVMEQFKSAPQGEVKPIAIYLFGSRLFGTSTEDSDYDVYAIHLESSEKILSGKDKLEGINVQDESLNISLQSYELSKAMTLAVKNNPNLVDMFLSKPIWTNKEYEVTLVAAVQIVKSSVSKEIVKPFLSMVEGNMKKYVTNEDNPVKLPKRYLSMINALLRCCSYIDNNLFVSEFDTLCKHYLKDAERKVVEILLKEKQLKKDDSEVSELAVNLITNYIDSINKVKPLSKLPDSTNNMDKVYELILIIRLYELRSSTKFQKIISLGE